MTAPRPPRRPADAVAAFKALRAEFPEWYIQHLDAEHGGGFAARMGNLTVRARTLDELARTLRDARDEVEGSGSGQVT